MENINIGIARSVVSGKLRDDFISTKQINESKNIASHFYFLIENSEILRNQYKIYHNLEKKHIESDVLATKYIDDNISNISKFSSKNIQEANEKLKSYINESDVKEIDTERVNLYNAINTLITESAKRSEGDADVDSIYESYSIILDHLKSNKKEEEILSESVDDNGLDMDMVVELAIGKFNSKYSKLDENELKIINILAVGSSNEKQEMFESLKSENLNILSSVEKNGIEDRINETIEKLSNMKYTDNTSTKDVISLYELKNNLS